MKRILLATAAVLAATFAQAETIYVTPNSVTHWHSKAPFKSTHSVSDELLEVRVLTDHDLIVVAKDPDGTQIASTNVLLLDDKNKPVDNLQVIVTPFGGPSITLRSGTTTYLCGMRCIPAAKSSNKGMGDADSMTVTTDKNGSTATSKTWLTPPKT